LRLPLDTLRAGFPEADMTNQVLLDNVTHKDLRVRTDYSADFGDAVNNVMVFPTEFIFVQREYPILFRRDDNGALQSVAMLGLDKDENLFLDGNRWNARYVPCMQQRGPFLIGMHRQGPDTQGGEAMIHVDMDSPRISQTEGEPVFLEHGGNSPYLEHVSRILGMINDGVTQTKPMFDAFEAAQLIEDMEIEIELDETLKYKVPGYQTISRERLAALDGAELERLNEAGYLQLAMLVISSLGNISWLIELKNRRRAAERD
jgi:hypothetical protein